jgi:hypothetical protein
LLETTETLQNPVVLSNADGKAVNFDDARWRGEPDLNEDVVTHVVAWHFDPSS